ncbi:MAG: NTP transferase domain-containing protein [Patescibacteria group bacterium]|jgi:bifunctional UDP-N-acetylglucosamine pyrophosphorylase/glucosamine-1-phosphate N-acetyltransferase
MNTRVVVLAAGKGKRMGADLPKPLVEIAGKPIVEHLLSNIIESGVDPLPILVISPDATELFRPICENHRCEFAFQEEQLGTGHATRMAKELSGDADTIVVLNGDHPFTSPEVIQELVAMRTEHHAAVSMITAKVPNYQGDFAAFQSWGRIKRDTSGNVEKIVEVKDAGEEELAIKEVNPALYAFDAHWLWEHLPELQNKNVSKEYHLTDLIEIAIGEGEDVVTAHADPFEVIGINTPEELERAERLLGK